VPLDFCCAPDLSGQSKEFSSADSAEVGKSSKSGASYLEEVCKIIRASPYTLNCH